MCTSPPSSLGKWQDALGLGVDGEPVAAVDLLVIGGVGGREVFVAAAQVVGHGFAGDEDDLELLLIDPDLALEVAFVLDELFGLAIEDVSVDVVNLLPAEVGEVVLGQLGRSEDEGQAMLDVVEIGLRHDDFFDGVLGREDDVLGAAVVVVEDDVGDLLVLSVGLAGVVGNGLDGDGLAEGVILAGFVEGGFAGAELGDDLLLGEVGGRGGIDGAEAGRAGLSGRWVTSGGRGGCRG